MATLKTNKFGSALLKKGFKPQNTHHRYFYFYDAGSPTRIHTYISNGEKDFGELLIKARCRQMGNITKKQLKEFIDCSFTQEQYRQHLIETDKMPASKGDSNDKSSAPIKSKGNRKRRQ